MVSSSSIHGAEVEFQGASKAFVLGTKVMTALQDVTFTVHRGEFVSIVGPSGCGKSTTLNILAGLTEATGGRVLVEGHAPGEVRLDLGYVFQQDTVLPWKKVVDNIEIGLKLRGMPAAERRARADQLLKLMGLESFGNAFPAELSGGMRKRVALGSTLAYNPALLLMDEPFGSLDAQTRITLQDELLRLWNEQRQTVLFVTHDIAEAIVLADRVIVMTARPARIKKQYFVDLPRPRLAEDVRFDPRFEELHKQIWDDLRPEIAEQTRVSGSQA
jgi:NitT/TauT family transport system ATP-binding protein